MSAARDDRLPEAFDELPDKAHAATVGPRVSGQRVKDTQRCKEGQGARAVDLIGDLQALTPDREVDIALLNTADPLFLKKITETAALVYGSQRRLHEFKMYAFKRYQDHRRYLALERDYVARTLRAPVR